MKYKKSIIILMLVAVVFLSVAGSWAGDANDTATLSEDSAQIELSQEIYVSADGSDSGPGTSDNPYASLHKSISQVNASADAVVYVAAGNYCGENNTNLKIDLDHKMYNGSLTIIGDSNGGTVFNGNGSASVFASISQNSIVTLINITFINGKSNMGSAIRSSGVLTIDGCVFKENVATNLAAVYQDESNDVTIVNSKFLNNKATQIADIYSSQNSLITLVNNVFDGATVTSTSSYSPSCSIQTGKSIIKGNTFKNLKGSYYAGALHASWNNGDNIANITDNTFENCTFTGSNGAIMYFQNAYLKNNKFINCSSTTAYLFSNTDFNAFLTFEDVQITGTSFTLKANVTDDVGNKVKNAEVVFYLDGKNVGSANTGNEGAATLSVKKLLENGEYTISGTQAYDYVNAFDVTVVNGTATVDFDHTPAELWVSPNGDDVNGDGSQANPFLTLKHALDNGTASSVDVTVHMKNGLYNGSANRDLSYSNVCKITIIGESYDDVVIDVQNGGKLFTFGQYMEATLINLTITNCNNYAVDGYTFTMKDCIVKNSKNLRAQIGNEYALFDHVIFDKMNGQLLIYNGDFYNCEFKNSDAGTNTGFIWLSTNGNRIAHLENNTFFNNTIAGYSGGAAYYIQCSLESINNTFKSNTVTGSASNIAYAIGNTIISINDKFIDNEVPSYIVQYRNTGNNPCEIIVENITVVNNRASINGAGLATTGAKVKGGKFINNTASGNGGAIYVLTHSSSSPFCEMSIEDCIFENNSAACGSDIFIVPASGNNVPAEVSGLTITANDLIVTELCDTLTVTVSHPSGAIIGGGDVNFYIDGLKIDKIGLINQNATITYIGFKNNTVYNFTSVYDCASKDSIYVDGKVTANIARVLESIELYVSDRLGDDENGDGSIKSPYKSISKALYEAYKLSTNITVHILKGNYSGSLNTNLKIPSSVYVTLTGENGTVISDSSADYFITAKAGNSMLTISNMKVDRAARDTQSAIYIEQGANVKIDNVTFINGQGNYGGAINTAGNLAIINSYFNDNGYADQSKSGNAYYGGAIYNDGVLTVDNTVFEADHATRLSEISTQGTLYVNNSKFIDSICANGMNMDMIAIGAFGGQEGNITIENTLFMVTNRTINELTDRVYNPENSLTCLGIGSCEHATIINCSFVNEGARFAPYVFGGINAWNLASGGYSIVPGDIEVYNSTFKNVQAVNVFYSRIDNAQYHSHRTFDGCFFDNVEYLIAVLNNNDFSVSIKNSVIMSDDIAKIGFANGKSIEMNISDNWWMSNNASFANSIISTTNYIRNYVLKLKESSSQIASPESYLVLTLDISNRTGLLQDVTLAFKSSDGENITEYNGKLYPRYFTISAENATLDVSNGTISNKVIVSFEGMNDTQYFIEASIDNATVNLTGKVLLGYATIIATDIEITTSQKQINVTVLDGANPSMVGKIRLELNGRNYTADINNGIAIFDIEAISGGEYDLKFFIDDYKVFNLVSNSSKLKVKIETSINLTKTAIDMKIGDEAIINATLIPADAGELDYTSSDVSVVKVNGIGELTAVGEGSAIITVSFMGNDNYTASKVNVTVTVKKIKTELTANDITATYNINKDLVITLKDSNGKAISGVKVTVDLNGAKEYITDANGQVKVVIKGLSPKTYIAKITFNGDTTYDKTFKEVKVTVKKATPKIIAKKKAYKAKAVKKFKITLKDNTGKPIKNVKVRLFVKKIAKKTKKIKTKKKAKKNIKKTNKKGKATFKIDRTKKGKYWVTVKFYGNKYYTPVTKKVKITIK